MQKVLKKIVSILFTLVLISSIGIVSSFAYQVPQNSETAVLKGNEHYSCSGKVIGTFKLFGAKTKRESNRAMTACSMYFNASKSFKYDKKIKVGIGKDLIERKHNISVRGHDGSFILNLMELGIQELRVKDTSATK